MTSDPQAMVSCHALQKVLLGHNPGMMHAQRSCPCLGLDGLTGVLLAHMWNAEVQQPVPCQRVKSLGPELSGWCRTLVYLQDVAAERRNSNSLGKTPLLPTEQRTAAGCVTELDANYKGDLLSPVIPSTPSVDACCQLCKCVNAQYFCFCECCNYAIGGAPWQHKVAYFVNLL